MKQETIDELMKDTPLLAMDAARLVLECMEEMNDILSATVSRTDLLAALRRVIRAGVAAVRAAEHTVPFAQAAWQSVEARKGRRPTTTRDLRNYVRRMLRMKGVGKMPLRAISAVQCREILQQVFGNSVHSYRKGRAVLHSIFAYGMRRGWCDSNPVALIEVPPVREKLIAPLNLEEVSRLRKTAELSEFRDMRFSLSLLLYSGVRPAEVARLRPDDVLWQERQVIIRPRASKTGGGRVVQLRPLPGLQRKDCYVPCNWAARWRRLRRRAGFDEWVPDVCRHTFASYYATHFRNLPELQLEMGHRDTGLLRSRYVMPTRRKEAALFWKR